ncbi:MAG: hypothetical protein OEY36_07250 [Gammaproteobacteria bacterium]|nr:hypothetical protein [Gammaproteobacteria bacterium]
MPYRKSSARCDCEKAIKHFISQSKTASLKKNKIPYDIMQCVFKSAFFQSSAALEDYIKAIFEDWLTMLHKNNCNLNLLPSELINMAIINKNINAYKSFIVNGDEYSLMKKVMRNSQSKLLHDNSTKIKKVIHQSEYIADKKYPSEDNLLKAFRRFGINHIFNEVNRVGKRDFKFILKSFSDTRTSIAHEVVNINLTYQDVNVNLRNIIDFVQFIDKVLHKHVTKNSGSMYWPS